jgi:hypothetical protein
MDRFQRAASRGCASLISLVGGLLLGGPGLQGRGNARIPQTARGMRPVPK